MPFIEIAMEDAKEASSVPEGEYDLRVVKVEDKKSKAGNPMTQVTIRIEDPEYPNAALLNHFINYPTKDTPADQRSMRMRDIGRFLQLFSIPYDGTGFNSEDINGATARAHLTTEENEETHDVYNRLVLPRMKD